MLSESLFLLSIITLFSFFLGVLVLIKNPRNRTHQIFFLMVCVMMIWISSHYFQHEPNFQNFANFLLKLDFASGIWLSFLFFLFCINFPRAQFLNFGEKILLYLPPVILSILSFTPLILREISFRDNTVDAQPGKLFLVYFVFVLFYIFSGLKNLLRKYKKADKEERLQILYMFLGLAISGIIIFALNLILAVIFPLSPQVLRAGNYSLLLFCVFTSLAILKYHLFEIRVILTEFLIGIMGIFQLVFSFFLPGNYKFLGLSNFLLFLIFAYYLLKVVHREERKREEAEKMAEKERKLRMEIERLSKAKGQFILSAQHYFRTPLTSIIGYLSLILEDFENQSLKDIKRKLNNVFASAQELRKRIEEGLTIAAFQTKGGGVLHFQEVKFEDFIKEIFEELRFQEESKKLKYELKVPKIPLPKIKIDPQRMKEAISNLIDNAIKYTQKGGVFVSLEKKTKSILLKISDTGIGVPKEELSFLGTTPFERGEGAKKLTPLGKGIGLYLSRLIIEAHGGKLKIESEGEGKGTTVYVELPTP